MKGPAKLALLVTLLTVLLGATVKNVFTSGGVQKVTGQVATPKNIVVIILDDWGHDQWEVTNAGTGALTPEITALAATGIYGTRFVTAPNCSPARASGMTGQYPRANKVGFAINYADSTISSGLDSSIPTFVDVLNAHHYRTVGIGKSHMSGASVFTGSTWSTYMQALGFDYWEGTLQQPNFGGGTYTSWIWFNNTNSSSTVAGYLTEYTADRAIAMLPPQGPFFMWVAFNAPHSPHHCPPDANTPTYDAVCTPLGAESAVQAQYYAMLEAADAEVGRFVAEIDLATTTVIIIGDNGTTYAVGSEICAEYPNTKCKATGYFGGVGVPFIAFGDQVTDTGETKAPMNIADLAKTIISLAGLDPSELPSATASIDMTPVFADTAARPRAIAYAEGFKPNGTGALDESTYVRSANNAQYHLVRLASGAEELYDLDVDPWLATDLNDGNLTAGEQAAITALRNKINNP